MNTKLEFGGEEIAVGSQRSVELPVSRLPNGSELSIPIQVFNGANKGPSLWISAAIHGNELNGVEIARRVLERIRPEQLNGVLYAIPIVNVFGFLHQSRYLPDGRDLNRSFPGSMRGSLAARIASLFLNQVVDRCQYGIDLHTAGEGRTNLAQVRANLDDSETLQLACAFGAPALLHSKTRDGSLRASAQQKGVRTLLYEAGEPLRFDRGDIEIGVRGVLSVMESLNMIDLQPDEASAHVEEPAQCRKSTWVRARTGGMYRSRVQLGDRVNKGESLGFIWDPMGTGSKPVRAPNNGIVIGQATNPLVYRGDALVHVGLE
ncbi:MAG: succinylglutamate desuccinylase/aspartoacylase family protein [Planctomycetota bacterium]|nr:succinylglutamate desuccinylase/aspartoacylase family protein [Planctomycetota bacterium]